MEVTILILVVILIIGTATLSGKGSKEKSIVSYIKP